MRISDWSSDVCSSDLLEGITMRKILYIGSAALLSLATVTAVNAQDTEEPDPPETTDEGSGATVHRENTTDEPQRLEANGDPVLDEAGTPVTENVSTGFTHTSEHTSGNTHTQHKHEE